VPLPNSFVVKNGSKIRSIESGSMPVPVSLIVTFTYAPSGKSQQSAACNAIHTIEARLSRWLLRCRDLTESEDLPLTQEFIAQMLGVRRTSVSIVANTLQQAGLIKYKRGHIRVLDLEALRESACECYWTVKSLSDRLIGPPHAS